MYTLYACTYTHMYMHMYMHAHIHTCTCTCTHIGTHNVGWGRRTKTVKETVVITEERISVRQKDKCETEFQTAPW